MNSSEYFKTTGEELARRWDEGGGADEFPEIATQVLREIEPPTDFSFIAATEWALDCSELPNQVNFHSGFGSPPIVVFADEEKRFYIELLVWFPSRTAIHGHGFSGAFRVMGGYSVQCRYEYEGETICEGLRQGKLTPVGLDFLSPGKINPIKKDEGFIHTVIHMGKPSLTLVVRTPSDPSTKFQYEYYRSGLAMASFLNAESLSRQVAMLRSLRHVDEKAFELALPGFIEKGGLYRFAQCLLDKMAPEFKSEPDLFEKTRDLASAKFGKKAEPVLSAFEEANRTDVFWALINERDRPDLEFLTSLRELIPQESVLHDLIRKGHSGDEPGDTLARWESQTLAAVEG